MTHTHKGKPQDEASFKRNPSETIDAAFKRFWKSLAQKTHYTMAFNEESLINTSTERIKVIEMPDYVIEVSSHLINSITEECKQDTFGGTESIKQKDRFTPLDLVEGLSENVRRFLLRYYLGDKFNAF